MKLKPFLALLSAGIIGLAIFSGCSNTKGQNSDPEDYPVHAADTVIDRYPQRVVSISPATTDMLMQLNLRGRVVGISDYCDLPAEEGALDYYDYPRVGTPQLPDIEAIQKLGAQVVFTTAPLSDAQTQQLLQSNIDVVVLPPADTMEGIRETYTDIYKIMHGEITGAAMAQDYLNRFDARWQDIQSRAQQGASALEQPKSAVYLAGGLLTLATGDTLQGRLLTEMGLENWGADYTGYTYPKEKQAELNPDIILFNGMLTKEEIAASDCYKTTPAGKNNAIWYLDSSNFERQSPDLLDTLWQLGQMLYPESFIRQEPGGWEEPPDSQPEEEDTAADSAQPSEDTETAQTPSA